MVKMRDNEVKFGFVILNYKTPKETEKCVDTILKRIKDSCELRIVIIDNGSGNDDCYKLYEEKYKSNENIYFHDLKENLGFARGNNFGYHLLAEMNFIPDFSVFINNDVYIISNDFCEQVINEYNTSNFSVLGPCIIQGNNTIDTCPFEMKTKRKIQQELNLWKLKRFMCKMKLGKICFIISAIINKCQFVFNRGNRDRFERKESILLHGPCLVFSSNYFDSYDTPFDDRTFLYKEEELLLLRLKNKGLLSVYLPDLIVFHQGGASSYKASNINKSLLFQSENYIKSLKILLEELDA